MLFNSFQFLVFFFVFFIVFFSVPQKIKPFFLLLASSYFYYSFIPVYILILYGLILVDFFAGLLIEKFSRHRLFLLVGSIVANIGILSFFKYYNFFTDIVNNVTGSQFLLLNILLPVGLSFHTFQSLSYVIEVYKGNYKAERNFFTYALYVMYFPQLVAGPIERPYHLIPQLKQHFTFQPENIMTGLRLIVWGFFKKIVVADRLGMYVDMVYNNPGEFHWLNVLLAVFYFAIQLYCDFSGYSDIAIGLAKMMGIDLMINFNRPFFASTIRDLWNRWHISLTSWFRDYVYIPLGGNKKGLSRQLLYILIVFSISGLWHGANFTFVLFGVSNGILISMLLLMNSTFKKWFATPAFINCLFTFFLFSLTCIFFRAETLEKSFSVFADVFSFQHPKGFTFNFGLTTADGSLTWGNTMQVIATAFLLLLFIIEYKYSPTLAELNKKPFMDTVLLCSLILIIVFFGIFQNKSFIYFQF